MDKNIEIITTVFSQAFTAPSLRALSKYYAIDFTYKSPLRSCLNFEEYCQNIACIKASSEFEVVHIEDMGCCYEVKLDITIIHGDRRKMSKITAMSYVYFKDGVIQSIVAKYKPTPMQLAYILKNTLSFSQERIAS